MPILQQSFLKLWSIFGNRESSMNLGAHILYQDIYNHNIFRVFQTLFSCMEFEKIENQESIVFMSASIECEHWMSKKIQNSRSSLGRLTQISKKCSLLFLPNNLRKLPLKPLLCFRFWGLIFWILLQIIKIYNGFPEDFFYFLKNTIKVTVFERKQYFYWVIWLLIVMLNTLGRILSYKDS